VVVACCTMYRMVEFYGATAGVYFEVDDGHLLG
jgi:hypothetical protein